MGHFEVYFQATGSLSQCEIFKTCDFRSNTWVHSFPRNFKKYVSKIKRTFKLFSNFDWTENFSYFACSPLLGCST